MRKCQQAPRGPYYIGWVNGPNSPFYMDECPRDLMRLNKEQQRKECSRAEYLHACFHCWRKLFTRDLHWNAAQLAANIEWPHVQTPYDRKLTPEDIQRLDAAVLMHLSPVFTTVTLDINELPGPRWAGNFARIRRETLARGEPFYGPPGM